MDYNNTNTELNCEYQKVIKMYSNSQTKIFIDGAYFMFNCFTELKNNQFSNEELSIDVFENKKFVRLFERKFIANLYRISKKFNVHFQHFIFTRDCPRSQIWRNDKYTEYKQNRPKSCTIQNTNKSTGLTETKRYNIGNLFKHIYNDFMKKRLKENIQIMKFDKLEADDIIAISVKELEKNNKYSIIITEDSDFIQLCSDYVEIYNLKFENLGIKYQNRTLLDKILFGDKSDNISGIQNRYLSSDNLMNSLLNIDLDTFCRNISLINFNYIPTKLSKNVIDCVNQEILFI